MNRLDTLHSPEMYFMLGAISAVSSFVFVLLARKSAHLSGRNVDLGAVQAVHTKMTPRVGGVAIYGVFVFGALFSNSEWQQIYFYLLLAAAPLFIAGLLEDLGFGVDPKRRLVASVLASLLAMWLFGAWLPRIGVVGIDLMLQHWYIGIPLTALLTAGIANGFNLIDGLNGLASLTACIAAIAFARIAGQAGLIGMEDISIMLAAGILGFVLVNYPMGLIFLGDAGAYTLGFLLTWIGVLLVSAVPELSPWAVLLVLFWPVADTLLAIYRRMRSNAPAMAPDRLHVHQMAMRAIEICLLGRGKRKVSNPLATLVLMPFVATPPIMGVLLWDQNLLACAMVALLGGLFFAGYAVVPHLSRKFRLRKDRRGPVKKPIRQHQLAG